MVQVVKSEWHQVEKRYSFEIGESILAEIYPDKDEDEIAELLNQIENGEVDLDEIIGDADNEGVDLDWEWMDEDDLWTDRKGGYEVTYSLE
jgi:hypothetical protein